MEDRRSQPGSATAQNGIFRVYLSIAQLCAHSVQSVRDTRSFPVNCTFPLSGMDSTSGPERQTMTPERQTGPRYRIDESVFYSNQAARPQTQTPSERFI